MKKQTDSDAIRIVACYKQAGIAQVESVLKDYLVFADDYERRGWARY